MKRIFTILAAISLAVCVFCQVPEKMSYQAVVRNSSNQLVTNHAVGMKISILQGTVTGTAVYVETQTPTTNANGLVTLEIGGGTVISGTFAAINWANGPYFIKTETDPTGGTNYTITGTSQLLSVPYALYAKTAENGFSGNYDDLTNIPTLFNGDYNSLNNLPTLFSGAYSDLTGKPTTLEGYGITNAMSTSHVANGITSNMITSWNTAYGWGNHAGLYKSNSYVPVWSEITSKPTSVAGYGITDAVMITGEQNISGIKTFGNDLIVNGLTIGKGKNARSCNTAIGDSVLYNTSGNYNTAIGHRALYSNTTGWLNIAVGYEALANNTVATHNTAIGTYALWRNIIGRDNTAIGTYALWNNISGDNTATGSYALWNNTSGYRNTANGSNALYTNKTGTGNVAIGAGALFYNTEGVDNTVIGASALYHNTSGCANTANGTAVGHDNTTGSYNIFLGHEAGYYETGSNKLYIDNQRRGNESDARAKSLIYGVFDADPANQVLTINGKVGVRTSVPAYLLDVNGEITSRSSNAFRLRGTNFSTILRNDNVDFYILATSLNDPDGTWGALRPFIFNLTTGTTYLGGQALTVIHGGNVGIGAFTPAYKLTVNGTAWCSAGAWTGSDLRWKKDISVLTNVLPEILKLEPVNYELRTDEFPEMGFETGKQIGLIAQDVEKIYPELVRTDNNGYKAVTYEKLTVLLVEGMKEQQKQIEDQQKQIDDLKQLVNNLMQK